MKTALIQQKFHGNKKDTIEHTCKAIKEAAKNGADLVVLGELHQDRYFCINENTDNFTLAESFHEDIKFWSGIAKENGVVLVTSLFEKRAEGLYHNTAVVFENSGKIAGKYRKMHIPDDPGFYEKFYFTPGDLGFEPIKTSVGKIGLLVCWDQWYPEAARLMALKGADLLIYPTAIGWFDEDEKSEKQRQLEAWITIQRSHAIANGLPVISVNRVGKELDDKGAIDGIRFWGNSFAAGAQGELLAHADDKKECIVYFDLNIKRSGEVRRIWPFLRDRRIDAYTDITKRFID
ncbi:MAG: carbon-nitrogen hydrolase [Campylobacteraceae bacterium]|jgi:N-carbamoylputrescine amidase|nr:carbon-nitrogen hydrolase [Campylobacteraceae bacterium]